MNLARTLVVHDTDRIQDYIFATGRLKEIRGASALIDSLTTGGRGDGTHLDRLLTTAQGSRLVFAGGGNITVWFNDHDAATRFEQEMALAVYNETFQATTTGITFQTELGYLDAHEEAQKRLAERKNSGAGGAVSPLPGGLVRPCQSCSRQPASIAVQDTDGGVQRICKACERKREYAGQDLPRIYRGFFEDPAKRARRFELVPADFEEIGKESVPSGYIAVIYCDGDGIGQRLRELSARNQNRPSDEQEEEFRKFSKTLDEATRSSATEVLRNVYPEPSAVRTKDGGGTEHYYPFQIILCGGDDLLVVVPAHKALEIAAGYIDLFSTKSPGLTTSAGVIVAHQSQPFRELVDMSKQLLKSAKRRSRDEKKGCLDAMVLRASSSLDIKSERERSYYSARDPKADLAPRAMTVAEWHKFKGAIEELEKAKFPTSKIYALGKSLSTGYLRSVLTYRDIYGRASSKPVADGLSEREVLDKIAADYQLDDGPWTKLSGAEGKRRSPYLDIANWYRFIVAKRGGERD